ncbi:hypothetical protein O181_008210 [Austropuccinia psidii MF-1]|uniref:Uncharacterized protein n=1 Tax=Austropuccinia psidii MF-1 TaxID=1389203 RepID=A0A9Q3BPH6_9BASI|nr:hypothetical protein [Austropuccinia psidii MF-1]
MKTLRTHFGQGSPWTTFQPMASGNHQEPQDKLRNPSPQLKGDFPIPPSMPTKLHDSKSRSQSPVPILKEDSPAHQSGNPWRLSEDYSRTPTAWPFRSWVGNYFRIIPRAILRGYLPFNQFSWQKVIQYSLDNSIGPYRQQSIIPVCPWPNWANSITQFNSQDGQNCIGPIHKIQLVTHLPGSAPQPFAYTCHLSSPGDFFPS